MKERPESSSRERVKRLTEFTRGINILEKRGSGDPLISLLCYDSRQVAPGALFFALPGIHTDGHRFIPVALEAGASAVIHSDPLEQYQPGVAYLRVENPRTCMSPVAAAFYDHPSREMRVAGVTGTDGKSSTVFYLQQLISAAGARCGFLSTVEFHDGLELKKNALRQSTPEPPEVHALLRRMRSTGCAYAVVESTSHGLSPRNNRLGDIAFDVGVLTNISHEHLEFHGSMEQYVSDKGELFRMLPDKTGTAVLPSAEAYLPSFEEASRGKQIIRYVSEELKNAPEADLAAEEIEEDSNGISFTLVYREERHRCRIPLRGRFNVDNVLASLAAAAVLLESSPVDLIPLLPRLKPVRGRMQPVDRGQPFSVLVDYAHSPGSFEKLLPLLREQCRGRLIVLFGSAGERDREKRPIQGEIASRYADIIFLADEDPRLEDSMTILEEIAAGCTALTRGKELFLIPDRREAIREACELAEQGDLLVCLGKGHEGSIIGPAGPTPYDEEEAVAAVLEEMGYR